MNGTHLLAAVGTQAAIVFEGVVGTGCVASKRAKLVCCPCRAMLAQLGGERIPQGGEFRGVISLAQSGLDRPLVALTSQIDSVP